MTQTQKIAALAKMSGESDEGVLSAYLDLSAEKILNKCYPFERDGKTQVPDRYHWVQLEIAAYLLNKRGAEGETSHNENGISRSYESASVPNSMLKEVVPFVGVVGGD